MSLLDLTGERKERAEGKKRGKEREIKYVKYVFEITYFNSVSILSFSILKDSNVFCNY